MVALPWVARKVTEPDRYIVAVATRERRLPVLGPVAHPYRARLALVSGVVFSLAVISGPATGFLYIYAQNVERLSGVAISGMVVGAGILGFAGLVAGRWLADRVGRRPTAAGAILCIGAAGILSYSGGKPALVIGYALGVAGGGLFAPAGGAFVNELFPTAVRSSVAGWNVASSVVGAVVGLVAFGAIADVGNRFAPAALFTFIPAMALSGLLYFLPETRGHEPEWFWPTEGAT